KCSNCSKTGHEHKDCWAKGGGKAGEGPSAKKRLKKDKAQLVQEVPMGYEDEVMDDVAYMARDKSERLAWYDWFADSGSSSHI
ncbi:uncharacterized protein F5891DRAFT_933258, partial [Suillus fuscotomentosus]